MTYDDVAYDDVTCDDVFDLLTLPAASLDARSRERLDEHLSCCASCSRLAEALSPALSLFAEVEEDYGMAAGTSAWSDASDRPSAGFDVDYDRMPRPAAPQQGEPAWHAMRLAVAVLIGLTLGGLLYGRSSAERLSDDTVRSTASDAQLAVVSSSRLTAAALGTFSLTEACLPHAARTSRDPIAPRQLRPALDMLAQAQSTELACCTNCHTTTGLAADHRDAIAQVARSCQTCHTN